MSRRTSAIRLKVTRARDGRRARRHPPPQRRRRPRPPSTASAAVPTSAALASPAPAAAWRAQRSAARRRAAVWWPSTPAGSRARRPGRRRRASSCRRRVPQVRGRARWARRPRAVLAHWSQRGRRQTSFSPVLQHKILALPLRRIDPRSALVAVDALPQQERELGIAPQRLKLVLEASASGHGRRLDRGLSWWLQSQRGHTKLMRRVGFILHHASRRTSCG